MINSKKNNAERRIFSKPEILLESANESPLKYQENEIARIRQYVIRNIEQGRPKMIAYLAPYGSGKSVILNNVLEDLSEQYTTMQFDIWQCSNRDDVWENFLIKAISKLNGADESKVIDAIDGAKIRWSRLVIYSLLYLGMSWLLWCLPRWLNVEFMDFYKDFLIYAAPVLITLAGINRFFPVYESRVKTLSQYRNKLSKAIRKSSSPVVIVVEDVDRSGAVGRQFLETLRCFLEDIQEKPVVIICPQKSYSFGDVVYDEKDARRGVDGLNDSIKVYDDVIYGDMTAVVTSAQAEQFLEKAGCLDSKLPGTIKYIIDNSSASSLLTMRSLKFMLRNIEAFIDADRSADPSIAFLFMSDKFLISKKGSVKRSIIRSIMESKIGLMSDPDDPRLPLILHVFDIDLNMYPGARSIKVELSSEVFGENRKIRRGVTDRNAIVCHVNAKYGSLIG